MKDKTIFDNNNSRKSLELFKKLITKYFSTVEYAEFSPDLIDNDKSLPIRDQINKNAGKVKQLLMDADIYPSVTYCPPPAIGGPVVHIDMMENIFNLSRYEIEYQALIDMVDRAYGNYESDIPMAILRTVNPFYWLGKILELIASIPFQLLGSVGFNRKQLEFSFVGKLVKLIIKVVTLCLTIWEFLYRLSIVPDRIRIF